MHPPAASGVVYTPPVMLGSIANVISKTECNWSTAWGKAVCEKIACTVWEGGAGNRVGPYRSSAGLGPVCRNATLWAWSRPNLGVPTTGQCPTSQPFIWTKSADEIFASMQKYLGPSVSEQTSD